MNNLNGCGKSTLMKVLAEVLYTDKQKLQDQRKGSVVPGAGRGVSARAYCQGEYLSIHGRDGLTRRQIRERYDLILDFAELKGSRT